MACDCIETVSEKLAPDHRLNTTMVFGEGEISKPMIALIRRDTWTPEKRRGKPGHILCTFCPFCGVRYEPEPPAFVVTVS